MRDGTGEAGWQHGDPFRNTDLKCPNLTGRSANTSTSLGIFHSVVQIGLRDLLYFTDCGDPYHYISPKFPKWNSTLKVA